MDSITHIALGAVMGEAIAGKSLGKRAMFYGAIAQSIPDIDVVAAIWLEPTDNILVHRGFTHSFLFGLLVTGGFAIAGNWWHRPLKIPLTSWVALFGSEILMHLLIDACNAYGVGWFEPFSHQRFSFHILFVADPLFTAWPLIAMAMLIYLNAKSNWRKFWIAFGLIACSLYFLVAVSNRVTVASQVKRALHEEGVEFNRLLLTPTPMNSLLWFAAAEADSGYYVFHRSVFDNEADSLRTRYFPRNNEKLEPYHSSHDTHQLLRFSQGYYILQESADTVIFSDLRFGQIAGWHDPKAKFVFHYYLSHPEENLMVIQRGRFSNWNRETVSSMIERIKSKD